MKKILGIWVLWLICLTASAIDQKTEIWKGSASGSSGNNYVSGLKSADNGDGSDAFQGSDGTYYFNTGAADTWGWDRYMKILPGAFSGLSLSEGDKLVVSLNYSQSGSEISLRTPNGNALFGNCNVLASGAANSSSYSLTLTSSAIALIQANGLLIGGYNLNWNEVSVAPGDYKEPEINHELYTTDGFHTDGTKLLDGNGKQFVMRGYNYSYTWQKDLWDAAFKTAAKYHCNALRIQLSDARNGDNLGGWTSADEVSKLIQSCKDYHFIGVFNVQDTGGGNDPNVLLQAADYWVSVKSAVIGQEKYCIVNIGNEWMETPVRYCNGEWGEYQENLWSDTYITAVRKMRNAGIKNTLMIDCNGYGQYADIIWKEGARILAEDARHFADGKPNIIFSIHFYEKACYWDYEAGTGSMVAHSMDKALSVGAPLCIGEYAYSRKSEQWKMDWETIQDYSKTMNVGYLGWSFTGNGDAESQGLDMFNSDGSVMYKNGECIINHPGDGILATSKTCSVYDSSVDESHITTPYVSGGEASADIKPYLVYANGNAMEYVKLNLTANQLVLNNNGGLTLSGSDLKRAGALEGRFLRLVFKTGTTQMNGNTVDMYGAPYAAVINVSYGSLQTGNRSISEWRYLDIPCDASDADLVIKGQHAELEGIYLMKPQYLYKAGQAETELKATYSLVNNEYKFNSGSTWGEDLLIPGLFFQDVQEGWTLSIDYTVTGDGAQISIKDGGHNSSETAENGVYYSWLTGYDSYNGTVDYSSISGSGTWMVTLSDKAYQFKDYKTLAEGMATGMLAHLKSEGLHVNGHDWTITGISLYGPKASSESGAELTGRIEVRRNLSSSEWRPISMPYTLSEEQTAQLLGSSVKLLTLTEVKRDEANKTLSLQFGAQKAIESNKPYLIKVAQDQDHFELSGVSNDVAAFVPSSVSINGVNLVSTAPASDGGEYTSLPIGAYFLYEGVFYPNSISRNIKSGLAYMTISTEAQAKGYNLIWDDQDGSTTGIFGVHGNPGASSMGENDKHSSQETNNQEVYTLQGTKLQAVGSHLPKGIYIINKRKVVVR